jgi:hypothetical protein
MALAGIRIHYMTRHSHPASDGSSKHGLKRLSGAKLATFAIDTATNLRFRMNNYVC